MDSCQLLSELIKTVDLKIDLMEYVIEKLKLYTVDEKYRFLKTSSVFDKIDWLNMEFLNCYQLLLKKEQIKDIQCIDKRKFKDLGVLKYLVEYAISLEEELDKTLSKL